MGDRQHNICGTCQSCGTLRLKFVGRQNLWDTPREICGVIKIRGTFRLKFVGHFAISPVQLAQESAR